MTRISLLFLLLAHLSILQAQIEIPAGDTNCKIQKSSKVSYCVNNDTYNMEWIAMQIKASDITNKAYLLPDSEFFKNMPNNVEAVWDKIENQSRIWAVEFDSIYVVTGVHISDSSKSYYKAILKGCQGDGLAFFIDQPNIDASIKQYAITIKQLEEKTNLDFWPTLNKDLQDIFEADFSWDFWPLVE